MRISRAKRTRGSLLACLAVAVPAFVAATDADAQMFRPQNQGAAQNDEKNRKVPPPNRGAQPQRAPVQRGAPPQRAPVQQGLPQRQVVPRGAPNRGPGSNPNAFQGRPQQPVQRNITPPNNAARQGFQPQPNRAQVPNRVQQLQQLKNERFQQRKNALEERNRLRQELIRQREENLRKRQELVRDRQQGGPNRQAPVAGDRLNRGGPDRGGPGGRGPGGDARDNNRFGDRDGARGYRGGDRANRGERQFERRRDVDAATDKFRNMNALRQGRREQKLNRGGIVLEEPGQRRIFRGEGGRRSIISRDETQRFRRFGRDVTTRQGRNGRNITTMRRRNGSEIITETGPDGRLIRRYRRGPGGREYVLIDNRRTWRKWAAIGAGVGLAGLLVSIDRPRYRGPRDSYIVEYDDASYDDVYEALEAPPVERLERGYTLDEVLATPNLREYMRRIDLDSLSFDSGSWDVSPDQFDRLERVARAINRLVEKNPDEIVLIEGHTDAVGDEVDNLSLSDRRAEEVANILTQEFDVPPENLVTQGYGEEFLKIDTDGPERRNRRVTVRRITPLLDRRVSSRNDD